MTAQLNTDYKVLLLAAFGKDAELMRRVLEQSGFPVEIVKDTNEIVRCYQGGAGAARSRARDMRSAKKSKNARDFLALLGDRTRFTELIDSHGILTRSKRSDSCGSKSQKIFADAHASCLLTRPSGISAQRPSTS